MKKSRTALYLTLILLMMFLLIIILGNNLIPVALSGNAASEEAICFKTSYQQLNDSVMATIKASMSNKGIDDDPLLIFVFLINDFLQFRNNGERRCLTFKEIYRQQQSNHKSNCMAVSAIMQKLGWNVRYYFNKNENYLGLALEDNWQIRKGNWIPQDGLLYYLKEFDLVSPIGLILKDDPAAKYQTVPLISKELKPIPLIRKLPNFDSSHVSLKLKWQYRDIQYEINVIIPQEQIGWTRILPSSIYGIGYSGIIEMHNIGLPAQMHPIVDTMQEYDRVSCLYKFSQAESIFAYCKDESIKSISRQLIEAKNDCDGRSVFLYALLRSVLEYADSEIVFVSWENHVALALKPRYQKTIDTLTASDAYEVDKGFYLLDAAYGGASYWGAKMPRLGNKYDVIRFTD